jgi:2-methylcitrate dehydratase PrpD
MFSTPIGKSAVPDKEIARALSEKLCQVRFSDFSAATVHKAKLHVLDTLGAGIAGAASVETQTICAALNLQNNTGPSAAWGLPFDLDARSASFVNGISAHALELDDSGGCDHSGAVVLPAALAILPLLDRPVSGPQFLTAVLMGYEVGRRVLESVGGYEAHNQAGWHSTGTCGVFGAAAASALLLGLDAPRLEQALGIACSFSGGTWGFIHDGSQTKKLHAGHAAEGGLTTALLAAKGFTGPSRIFDADAWGSFFKTFAPNGSHPSRLIDGFGENWRLDRCSIKPYATCRGTHSAIDALQALLSAHQLPLDQIAGLEAVMSRFQFGMCGNKAITSRADAQMSLPYALAARLAFAKVGLAELEQKAWSSSMIQDWLGRIEVRIDDTMADEAEPVVTIVSRSGQRHTTTVPFPLGSPQNPLADHQVIEKFAALSQTRLSALQSKQVQDVILHLDTAADVRSLPSMLKTAAGA